jgi:hypothetical protein
MYYINNPYLSCQSSKPWVKPSCRKIRLVVLVLGEVLVVLCTILAVSISKRDLIYCFLVA